LVHTLDEYLLACSNFTTQPKQVQNTTTNKNTMQTDSVFKHGDKHAYLILRSKHSLYQTQK